MEGNCFVVDTIPKLMHFRWNCSSTSPSTRQWHSWRGWLYCIIMLSYVIICCHIIIYHYNQSSTPPSTRQWHSWRGCLQLSLCHNHIIVIAIGIFIALSLSLSPSSTVSSASSFVIIIIFIVIFSTVLHILISIICHHYHCHHHIIIVCIIIILLSFSALLLAVPEMLLDLVSCSSLSSSLSPSLATCCLGPRYLHQHCHHCHHLVIIILGITIPMFFTVSFTLLEKARAPLTLWYNWWTLSPFENV